MLVEELRALADDPLTWAAVPALAAFAGHALWHWRTCPLLDRTKHVTLAEAEAAVDQPRIAGPRFLVLMLLGIAATLAGLSFIAEGIYPTAAFYLLLAGVFVIQTEPARLQIREAELRVVAAERHGEDARRIAIERLETLNIWLLSLELAILAGVMGFLLAF
jgi:hypothetical protein